MQEKGTRPIQAKRKWKSIAFINKNKVMKSFTDIEQSKKLAEILPIESADMFYTSLNRDYPWIWIDKHLMEVDDIPCWSLATLFELLPKEINVLGTIYSINIHTNNKKWSIDYKCNNEEFVGVYSSSLVDACVEMIVKLKENNLL